uniref:ATP-binding protein n=1 Tax=Endozoicomonas sp. ONNA2 TaxID=2828741 RepID=UPI0021475AB3
MMAPIQQSGLIRLTTRYYKAIRAGWRAARAGWQVARKKHPDYDRPINARSAGKQSFPRYLKSPDGQPHLRPLNSAMMPNEQMEQYEGELLAALDTAEQPEIRNIAISGAIGSGKSAFIHAFTERNPQFNCTRIYLPALSAINAN